MPHLSPSTLTRAEQESILAATAVNPLSMIPRYSPPLVT